MEGNEKRRKVDGNDCEASPSFHIEQDLPLLANVDEVNIRHYLMKLRFDLDTQNVNGVVVIFLQPQELEKSWEKIILDCCYITVTNVFVLKNIEEFQTKQMISQTKNFYKAHDIDWFTVEGSELKFMNEKWSINISGWPSKNIKKCPSVIRIHYEVSSFTPSLNWRPTNGWEYNNRDSSKCVFTPGSSVNNRGLFPCQEPPKAMATWECFLRVGKIYHPLLSSDEEGEVIEEDTFSKLTYFYSSMVLPMSTFALVIAQFPMQLAHFMQQTPKNEINFKAMDIDTIVCDHEPYPCRIQEKSSQSSDLIPVRLFSVVKELNVDLQFFSKVLEIVLKTLFKILGPHPFSRIDLVILPNCFPVLGLCSPHLIFLSPSLFFGKEPLYYFRLSHEISHLWFGLSIGCLNFEEEFLTEGFATFIEDIVYKEICHQLKPGFQAQEEIDTKACLHLLTLQNELQNTDSNLHVLCPSSEPATLSKSVKYGLEPMKGFMQVHYLKGYFLLKYLSHLVGQELFLLFLKKYVIKYHGQLVNFEIFYALYNENFSNILSFHPDLQTLKNLQSTWLRSTDLPEPFKSCNVLEGKFHETFITIFPFCQSSHLKIQTAFQIICSNPSEPNIIETCLSGFTGSQSLLILEKFISYYTDSNVKPFNANQSYKFLMRCDVFKIEVQNPDIIHRICELIILNKDVARKHILEQFLDNHQSLGLYLYGELMISEERTFQNLARRLYKKLVQVLDSAQRKILEDMIF